ncbi:MAG: hypothetical protein JXL84_10985 [Deltaproteobacteria bacterium]|nr:hypothetical protein [Deltaproteobacteria bacterium]
MRRFLYNTKLLNVPTVLVLFFSTSGYPMENRSPQKSIPPSSTDVYIAPNAVMVPMGHFLLIKKNNEYCALKFLSYWNENHGQDRYATYISYYQGDGTGNFTKDTVQLHKGELSFPKPRGVGRLSFSFGKKEVICGPIRLFWAGNGYIYFHREGQEQGDHGIELAPTKWTDISQVNVADHRLKWYRYDPGRPRSTIPLENLWPE